MIWFLSFSALVLAAVFRGNEAMDYLDQKTEDWTKYDSLFKKFGSKYGVRWEWLKATCLNESNLGRDESVMRGLRNPADIEGSKSSDGKSWGIMQVTLKTAKLDFDPLASEIKLNNPSYSIDLAARYWARTMKQFISSDPRYLEWVVKSYNQGAGRTMEEMAKKKPSAAQEYWERWQRNYQRVLDSLN